MGIFKRNERNDEAERQSMTADELDALPHLKNASRESGRFGASEERGF